MTQAIFHTDKCILCFQAYGEEPIQPSLLLTCGHIFHESCLRTWLERRPVCPLCQKITYIPNHIKNIVREILDSGVDGVLEAGRHIAKYGSILTLYFLGLCILNFLFPGRWRTSPEEIDAYAKEHGVLFDFHKPEGFIRLGSLLVDIAFVFACYYMFQAVQKRRNQPVVTLLTNYRPPALQT